MQAHSLNSRKKRRSARLAQLIRIYESGQVSELMDRTLDKLFSVEAAEAQKDIDELSVDLLRFEERFGMTTEDFYNRFEAGEMGDDADFIEWASFYNMYQHAKTRFEVLSDAA